MYPLSIEHSQTTFLLWQSLFPSTLLLLSSLTRWFCVPRRDFTVSTLHTYVCTFVRTSRVSGGRHLTAEWTPFLFQPSFGEIGPGYARSLRSTRTSTLPRGQGVGQLALDGCAICTRTPPFSDRGDSSLKGGCLKEMERERERGRDWQPL